MQKNHTYSDEINLEQVISEGSYIIHINQWLILSFIFYVYGPLNLLRTILPFAYLSEIYGKSTIYFITTGLDWLNSFLGLFVFIGLAFIVEKTRKGEQPTLAETFRYSYSRLNVVFWTDLRLFGVVMFWTLFLIVPGIVWSTFFSFAIAIAALRDISGKNALDKSKRLVNGHFGKIFFIQFVIGMVASLTNLFILLFSRQAMDFKLISYLIPFTTGNITSSVATVMLVVLFLQVEQAKELDKQNRLKAK